MIYISLFLVSLIVTLLVRYYTNKKNILDIPNARSSHDVPVPRGGGVAIVITFYIGLFYFRNSVEASLFFALLGAVPIAIVGMTDDIVTLSAKVRLLIQSLSALLALYLLGGVTKVDFIIFEMNGWWVNILAFFIIMWLTNLYNFLDGIDGYAASQAVIVGLGMYIFFADSLGLVIVASGLGFLLFNWHQASIFMGDVGSTTLGFIFAIFLLHDTGNGNIYIWLILLSLFWFDATLTLIRRYVNSETLSQAHKKHAYQRLTQAGWSHSKVVLYAIVINLLFIMLMYSFENHTWLFILNLITLYGIVKYIDRKKGFNT